VNGDQGSGRPIGMNLYSYFRSSASYRVRIALNLKGAEHATCYVHLLKGGGEQHGADYRKLNPLGLVPALQLAENDVLTQSLAICEYLDERIPEPPLLPRDIRERAYVRELAALVACDIHPICNLRVLKYLKEELHVSEEQTQAWYRHWVLAGFQALEAELDRAGLMGEFALGDQPSLADIFIVPQVFNARRFSIPLDDFPRLQRINDACLKLKAFIDAEPGHQPDAREA
jgi:maleylacetoacetate isomerase